MLTLGRPFDLYEHRYLEGVYRDTGRELVICKAGQVGVSEFLVSTVLWAADELKATGLYVFPTDTAVSDFAAARLGPAIEPEVSQYLSTLVVAAQRGGSLRSRGADRVGLKRVGDRFVYFRGARIGLDGRAPQLRSVDADLLILDEYDEMDPRAAPIARERLGHSKIGLIRAVSTPTYYDIGVHALYLDSDQRKWFVKCTGCSRMQDMELNDLIIEWDDMKRPSAWHSDKSGRPYVACRSCGKPLDRAGDGEWVATYPDHPVHGYHISRMFVPFRSLQEIIEGLRSVDQSERQQVYNQALGLPYELESAERLTDTLLNACRREYLMRTLGEDCVCGVDVGARQLHVVIRKFEENGDFKAVFIGTVADFQDVSELLRKHDVRRCVVDALPETRAARDFQAAHPPGRVWLAYYDTTRTGYKRVDIAKWEGDGEGRVTLDRTRILDLTFASLLKASRGEPGHTLPADIADLPGYYSQLTSLQRVLQATPDGNPIATYIQSRSDHYAHAEAYCSAAALKPLRPAELPMPDDLFKPQRDLAPWTQEKEYRYA